MKSKTNFSTVGNLKKSVLMMLPMILLNLFFITRGDPNTFKANNLIAFSVTFLYLSYLFFMILYTGRTDRYRAAGFISFAIILCIGFYSSTHTKKRNYVIFK